MFERFTATARMTVVCAQEESRMLKHPAIGVEHLLLGVVRAKGRGARALKKSGVGLQGLRAQVAAALPLGSEVVTGQVPFTDGAKDALEAAMRDALHEGEAAVDSGHLLQAMAGADVLEACGASTADIHAALAALPAGTGEDDGRPPAAAASPPGRLTRRLGSSPSAPPPDPRDRGPAIAVALDRTLLGDLGHPRVDARLLLAITLRGGHIAQWLGERGIDEATLREHFGELDLGFEPPEAS